jgi:hypothetical protein
MSGRQLFIIDKFRDTERPLLSVMADPQSIFMSGLRKFKRHTLYSNITNDRSAVYYTTCIQKTDPYRQLNSIAANFVKGRDNIALDRLNPFTSKAKISNGPTYSSVWNACVGFLKKLPLYISIAIFVPIGVAAFLVNSCIQNVRSSNRIKLHEKGQLGVSTDEYRRFPLLIKELRGEVETAYEVLNSSQAQEYLATEDEDDDVDMDAEQRSLLVRERRLSIPTQPTLALAPCQFEMIRSLDTLNWRKYPVWIHNVRHSHGAIIARIDKKRYDEGYVVLAHYAEEEFLA